MSKMVFTIGHSNQTVEELLCLLQMHGIQVVADVRSRPYSRYSPQFDRETLKNSLKRTGIAYVFLGDELGARSDVPSCYENGKVRYDRLAQTDAFQNGLSRVEKGANEYRVCLICAEKEPVECHRTILVARQLEVRGIEVRHILSDGSIETQAEVLNRLMSALRLKQDQQNFFRSANDLVADAYRLQEARIAFERDDEKADASAA
jgi:uncharacterized protein (DUF488 family)